MTEIGNRQQLFEDMTNARRELMRSLLFLSEPEATACGEGDWCVRDVISHVTARECVALAAAQHLVEEGDPHFPNPMGDREFSQAAVRRRREFALAEIIDELDGTRYQILQYTHRMHNNELYSDFPVRATGGSKSVATVLHGLVEHDYLHSTEIWRRRAEIGLLHRLDFRFVINDERSRFMTALSRSLGQEMLSAEVCGYWTVKDLMAHLLSWDEEILRTVEHWTAERPWQQDALYDDEWNEAEVARRAEMDVTELTEGLTACQRKLMQLFDQMSDQELTTVAAAPWGERMSLLSFLYEMALHNSTHRANLETPRRPAPRSRKKR
ncbi:MAG: maleylpyruvate isomerase N-terminal domain-containing protein [Anaerolineae bacterium]